jgi:hypothetical protein
MHGVIVDNVGKVIEVHERGQLVGFGVQDLSHYELEKDGPRRPSNISHGNMQHALVVRIGTCHSILDATMPGTVQPVNRRLLLWVSSHGDCVRRFHEEMLVELGFLLSRTRRRSGTRRHSLILVAQSLRHERGEEESER